MEVHHHPNLHHKEKKWKEYFLEFLMIFLAVSLGFFAESYRENLVERHRETEFIQSYIEDLKTDTESIGLQLGYNKTRMQQLDSLMYLLSNQKIKGYENDLYFLGRWLIRSRGFQSNDRTIIQLKNSGSLRLIKNEQAADSMISYQKLVETLVINQQDERGERNNAFPVLTRMFNPFVFDKMVTIHGINKPTDNPPLRSYDPNIQLDLAAYVHTLRGSAFIMKSRMELLNTKATNLIAFLQKKYHLE